MTSIPLYPPGFLWGSATSAHQVEGNCLNNNWFAFEHAVRPDARPRVAGYQKAGKACEHWTRYREDIQLMRALGLNAYRFSVEWSKIEPQEGVFDESVLAHYEGVVGELRANGIEPMITLHHFTDPLWFSEKGGFESEGGRTVFARFAGKVVQRLSDQVSLWCTLNEPPVYAVNGYVTGEFPPAVHSPRRALRVMVNMLRAHTLVYRMVKERHPGHAVGLANNMFVFRPARRMHPLDRLTARVAHQNFNLGVLRYLAEGRNRFSFPGVASLTADGAKPGECDFFGVNYYTRFRMRFSRRLFDGADAVLVPGPGPVTDMGWEIYPEGLHESLHLVNRHLAVPLYVTENGIADERDVLRGEYIRLHIEQLDHSLRDGLDVRGYFYWSLLDNFEWAHGFTKRFGLYHVDFATQVRTLRPGGAVLRDLLTARVESHP